jgi:hypothetical protein
MTNTQKRVIACAKRWWKAHRPVGMSERLHLKIPRVNTHTENANHLAKAVAALINSEKATRKATK